MAIPERYLHISREQRVRVGAGEQTASPRKLPQNDQNKKQPDVFEHYERKFIILEECLGMNWLYRKLINGKENY